MKNLPLFLASRLYMLASRNRKVIVAVTLHRVTPSGPVQPCHVERCFRFLAANFKLIRPSELDAARSEPRVAIVTIDDGHADAYKHIFPIAKATGVPIALCIPTDFFFRGQWLWFDKIAWAMRRTGAAPAIAGAKRESPAEDARSFRELGRYLRRCPPAVRDEVIREAFCALGLHPPSSPPEEYRAITPLELEEMLSSGLVEIVGHTVTHTIATVLDDKAFDAELRQSMQEWQSFCNGPVVAFCYPNGEPGDFNSRTALAVRQAGYRYAFTSRRGTNPTETMDPLEMKRVHIDVNPARWIKHASGLIDLQNALERRFPAMMNALRALCTRSTHDTAGVRNDLPDRARCLERTGAETRPGRSPGEFSYGGKSC